MAPDGIGPLSLPHLRHMVLGSAFVYNGDCPDLFIAGTGKTTELYLYKWLRNTENGVPIFDKPHKIASPFKLKGTIFQTDDHNVHALWLKKDSVIHTVFNLKKQSFDRIGGIELPELASLPQSIAARINKDQSVDLFLELVGHSIPAKYANQNPSSKEWRLMMKRVFLRPHFIIPICVIYAILDYCPEPLLSNKWLPIAEKKPVGG